MTNDTTLTRPISDDSSPSIDAEPTDLPRRRLGSWQVAPGGTDTLSSPATTATSASQDLAGTVPICAIQTAAIPSGSFPSTLPDESTAATTAFPSGAPIAVTAAITAEHNRVELVSPPDLDEQFAPPVGLDATAPIGEATPTAPIAMTSSDVTLQLAGGATVPISLPLTAELNHLHRRLTDDPEDLDTALELALALQESGEEAGSATILLTLLAHYEHVGSPDEAAQVRRLLGKAATSEIAAPQAALAATARVVSLSPDQVTAPIAGDDTEGPEAATASIQASGADASSAFTAPISTGLSRTTGRLPTRTSTLDARSVTGRERRHRDVDPGSQPLALLPRDQLVFTTPLPAIESIEPRSAVLLADAEAEIAANQFLAALDTLTLAMALSPSSLGLWLRATEVRIRLGHRKRAGATLTELRSLTGSSPDSVPAWAVDRLALHTRELDTESLRRIVDMLVAADQARYASRYASALIQLMDAQGNHEGAIAAAADLTLLLPGTTEIALEGAVLAARHGSHGEVIDLWESAVAHGGDPDVAKASMAASVASASEMDHWRLLAETLEKVRLEPSSLCRDAYLRTSSAAPDLPVLKAGRALVLHAADDPRAKDALVKAAGDRFGSDIGRAAASISLVSRLAGEGKGAEYVSAVRTTLSLLANDSLSDQPDWHGLTGVQPNVAELSTELGEALMEAGDAVGAVEVLRDWHKGAKQHPPLVHLLADAYARTGQTGSALTILDELGMHHRKAGQLDEMAAVLRQMSRLAPTNIKVKSRLIDAYLQRGFVSEARAELIQRADLEVQAGNSKDACKSLQRAADLSWNLGLMNEAFGLYDRLLEIDPEDVGNRSALVNLYLQVGRLTEAAEHQRAVVDLALRHGRRHEAIAALHQVIGLTPDDMTAYYQLGELLSSMGEYQQAEKVYRRIVLMMPDDAVAQAKAISMAALKEEMTHA